MKFGLGKGLGALIPQDESAEEGDKQPTDNFDWDDLDEQEDNVVKVRVNGESEDSDIDEYEDIEDDIDDEPAEIETDLYEEIDEEVGEDDVIKQIKIENIVPNPYQPRKVFKPDALQELADSIKEHGIIQPLVVTKRDDGVYELLAGERRLQASKLVGLEKVPAIVRARKITNSQKLELALIENLQREDLNIIEMARAYRKLHDDFGMTYDQVASKVGRSRSSVNNIVRLLQLPVDFQRALMDGKIAEGHGRALLQVADRERQYKLYEMITKKKIATDQALNLAKQWTARPHLRKDTSHVRFTPETKAMEGVVKKATGMKQVKVQLYEQGGGKVEILFLNDDDYNHLMELFNGLN